MRIFQPLFLDRRRYVHVYIYMIRVQDNCILFSEQAHLQVKTFHRKISESLWAARSIKASCKDSIAESLRNAILRKFAEYYQYNIPTHILSYYIPCIIFIAVYEKKRGKKLPIVLVKSNTLADTGLTYFQLLEIAWRRKWNCRSNKLVRHSPLRKIPSWNHPAPRRWRTHRPPHRRRPIGPANKKSSHLLHKRNDLLRIYYVEID